MFDTSRRYYPIVLLSLFVCFPVDPSVQLMYPPTPVFDIASATPHDLYSKRNTLHLDDTINNFNRISVAMNFPGRGRRSEIKSKSLVTRGANRQQTKRTKRNNGM